MMYDAASFVFDPPPALARARKVLIKPNAGYPAPHPVTTSAEMIRQVIEGIRRVSYPDIYILEGPATGQSAHQLYKLLGYDFPRVTFLDVEECAHVEVQNPLDKPLALSSFWLPNILLSCDFLISVASYKVMGGAASLSIKNLIGLLPPSKYVSDSKPNRGLLHKLGIQKVVADLYFTIPFDLGVIDARARFVSPEDAVRGRAEPFGKVFVGDCYTIDREASDAAGAQTPYLRLIDEGRAQLEALHEE